MKKITLKYIVIVAMSILAVQGYAQEHGRSNRAGQRTEQRGPSQRQSSRNSVQRGSSQRQSSRSSVQRGPSQRQSPIVHHNRGGSRPQSAPRPSYHQPHHHHYYHGHLSHGHHHHHYACSFNHWIWHTWRGYTNRFIRHSYYSDRYFDNLLGYYIYGSLDVPTKLEIGGLSLTRVGSQLQVINGSSYTNLNLYQNQTIRYTYNYTVIDVSTGNGYAMITLYDDYGNQAVYKI